ncbi:Nramp family divalent metal transporter [soil metagenome]
MHAPDIRLGLSPTRLAGLRRFLGPAALVSVGYMDPGNWATDIEAGATFGYKLLWVLVAANIMAVLVQTLATRLGVVTGLDLAQACRQLYAKPVALMLWFMAEVAIIACDLAEIIGAAIALKLLFNVPLVIGAVLTVFDVFLVLALQRFGVRLLEAIVATLVFTIAVCFGIEIWLSRPSVPGIVGGLMPSLSHASLYIAISMVGATVMPHNLYLHSSLVKSRPVANNVPAQRSALRYYLVDTVLALNLALLVNAAILILAATVFASRGMAVSDRSEAFRLLEPLLGTSIASVLFAVALLCAGQSSTLTGALAGQIIMEGFLQLKLSPALRRLVTRLIAVIPAVIVLSIYGEEGTMPLLIGSQVVLSLQLPFALVPLIRITASRERMGALVSDWRITLAAAACSALIVAANAALIAEVVSEWLGDSPGLTVLAIGLACCVAFLLVWITFVKLRPMMSKLDADFDAS